MRKEEESVPAFSESETTTKGNDVTIMTYVLMIIIPFFAFVGADHYFDWFSGHHSYTKIHEVFVKSGDEVEEGDLLFEVSHGDEISTVESPADGRIIRIFARPDTQIQGTVNAMVIRSGHEEITVKVKPDVRKIERRAVVVTPTTQEKDSPPE